MYLYLSIEHLYLSICLWRIRYKDSKIYFIFLKKGNNNFVLEMTLLITNHSFWHFNRAKNVSNKELKNSSGPIILYSFYFYPPRYIVNNQ